MFCRRAPIRRRRCAPLPMPIIRTSLHSCRQSGSVWRLSWWVASLCEAFLVIYFSNGSTLALLAGLCLAAAQGLVA